MEGRKNSTNISDWKRVCRVVGSTQIMASPAPGVAACIGLHVSIWPSSKFSTEGNSWTDQHWLNKRAPDLVSGHPPRILEAMKVDYTPVFHPLCQYVDWQFNLDTRQVTSWFYRNFTSFKWNRLIERAASRGWLHDLHFAVSTFCVTSALEVEHQSCEFILRIKPNVREGRCQLWNPRQKECICPKQASTPGTVEVHNLIFCHQTPLEQQNQQLFLLAAAPLCDSLPRGK